MPETSIATDMGNIQFGLDNLWTDTNNKASPAVVALQRQKDMQNIIDQENSRLQIKKDQIKGAVVNTQRAIALSESDRKRQVHFIYIILLIILGLLIYLFLRNIEIFFPFVPSFVVTFLTIIAVVIIVGYIVILLRDIWSRSNTNFDELNLPPPVINNDDQQNKAMDMGDILGSINYANSCIGESCCDTTLTQWNMGTMKCVAKCPTAGQAAYKGACYAENSSVPDDTSKKFGIDYVKCGKAWIPEGQRCFVSEGFEPMVGTQPYMDSEVNLYSKV